MRVRAKNKTGVQNKDTKNLVGKTVHLQQLQYGGECKSGGDSSANCAAVGLLAANRNSIHFPSQRSSRLYTTRHPHFRVKFNISEHIYRIGKTVHLQQLQYGGECRSGGDGSAACTAAAAVSRKQKLYSSFFLCI